MIDWFLSRIKERPFYRENLIEKNRCARIDYAGEFHLDIIPSTTEVANHQPYAVPARDLSDWITNNPKDFAEWVAGIDQRSGGIDEDGYGRFVRAIRIMKRWRDHFFGENDAPSSMLLVTMFGKHDPTLSYYNPPAGLLYQSHKKEAAYIHDMLLLTHGCIQGLSHIAFANPTVPGENLGAGWEDQYLSVYLQRLKACISNLEAGIHADTEAESIEYYKKALGDSFPSQ